MQTSSASMWSGIASRLSATCRKKRATSAIANTDSLSLGCCESMKNEEGWEVFINGLRVYIEEHHMEQLSILISTTGLGIIGER